MTVPHGSGPEHVWLFPVTQSRHLWVPFARALAERLSLRALLIVATPQDRRFYVAQAEPDDDIEVVVAPDIYGIVVDETPPPLAELISRATAYERDHNISIMRHMVQADRHLGRGFMVGWNGRPRSYAGDRASLASVLHAVLRVIDHYTELAAIRPPGLVVCCGGGTGVTRKPVALMCRARGISFRNLASGRIGGLYYWSEDEFENAPAYEACIRTFPEVSEEEIAAVEREIAPPAAAVEWAKRTNRQLALPYALYMAGHALAQHVYARLCRYDRVRWGYRPFAKAAAFIDGWRDARYLTGPRFPTIAELPSDRRLVFFPLQFEPEVSLQGQSPECWNQIAVLLEVALSLPADALLVVKEHPFQLGRRPREVYERILALPNAVMVKPWERSHDLIRRSSLVCVINGSVAYEAAMLGKPVAYFSRHGVIRAVPHVHEIRNSDDLALIATTLAEDDDAAAERRRRDGARLYHAARAHCMDLGDLLFRTEAEPPGEAALQLLTDHLIDSLPNGLMKASPQTTTGSRHAVL